MTNGKYKKLFSDTVILAMGTFGSKLLVFLLMPFYTALLSPTQYSAAELITGTANLIMPFACMGITTGIFRFAAERGSDQRVVFSSGLALLGGGLGALLCIGLPFCFVGAWKTEVALILAYILFADVQAVCAQYVRAIDRTRL
ncbi:MAG: oligosaccharide flippase family protein, partial [Clostridia bacterium]|nr:oligosaccharide flippase family protein [Clostridia bacterium]